MSSPATITTIPLTPNATSNTPLACIGVLTSGGDSQGMNCVLFGLVAAAGRETEVYLIRDGYQGLVTGGPGLIEKGRREELAKYLHQGGTIIGSSRCADFRTAEGRKRAARNLLSRNISNLVVVGGDGSLTGANLLRQEWPAIVAEWSKENRHQQQGSSNQLAKLNLVGIIGSIDNDFQGTEMTVGADSALFRIQEAVDVLRTTAASHGRVMVVEVMGRNCGYLALSSALATEASYVFLPECPQEEEEVAGQGTGKSWQAKLAARIAFERAHGKFYHLVIVAEGACTVNGVALKATTIREYLGGEGGLRLDARLCVLAHTQRGGRTSAFDRLMSLRMGIDAFHSVKGMSSSSPSSSSSNSTLSSAVVLTLNEGNVVAKPLMNCVQETTKLNGLMREHKWEEVVALRGEHFRLTWNNFRDLMSCNSNDQQQQQQQQEQTTWAVAHIGDSVAGINAVLYGVVRYAHAQRITILAARDGLAGLTGSGGRPLEAMSWNSVTGVTAQTASLLGGGGHGFSPRLFDDPGSLEPLLKAVLVTLGRRQVTALVLVGDVMALKLAKALRGRQLLTGGAGKVVYIPATVKAGGVSGDADRGGVRGRNNVLPVEPELSIAAGHLKLGFDSALNKTAAELDDLAASITGESGGQRLALVRLNLLIATGKRFVTPSLLAMATAGAAGGGYFYPRASWSLDGGLENAAAFEETEAGVEDAIRLKEAMLASGRSQMVLIHTELYSRVAGKYMGTFCNFNQEDNPTNINLVHVNLCPLQMPALATPFDRKLGVKLGMRAAQYCADPSSGSRCGSSGLALALSPVLLSPSNFNFVDI